MRKYIYYIIILYINIVSCTQQHGYKNCTTFNENTINKKDIISLKGSPLILNKEIKYPVRIFCIDSIMLLVNRNTPTFLDKYNLKTGQYMGELISFGTGPDEMLIIKQIQLTDSCIWLFDQSQSKIFQYSLPDFYLKQSPKPSSIITLDEMAYNVLMLPTGKIAATTFNSKNKRLSFFDQSGKLIENKVEYPDFGKKLTEYEKIESFFCEMTLAPDNKNIILSYQQTDLIEIYDLEGNLKKRIHGPDHFFPALKQNGENERIIVSPKYGESRDAYFCPTLCNNEICFLYSGKYYNPNVQSIYLHNRIFVFDTNGNYLKQYNLDIPIFAFCMDNANKRIYGLTENPEIQIVEFQF